MTCLKCGIEECPGNCNAEATINELLDMKAGRIPQRAVLVTAAQVAILARSRPGDVPAQPSDFESCCDPPPVEPTHHS